MPLHIYFTTDIHGNYFIYDFRTGKDGEGSLQRAYGFVCEQRRRYGDDNVILIDGGDLIQGGPEAYFLNHLDDADSHGVGKMCRLMRYDAGAVGNHDIESGKSAMRRFRKAAGYPLLAANVTDGNGQHPFKPYIILRRGGMKVAVVGFTTPATKQWLPMELCEGYDFHDILPSAQGWAEKIRREENPDLLIAVLHSGWDGGLQTTSGNEQATRMMVEQSEGYDLVLFGHDHFSRVEKLADKAGRDIVCMNAGCYGYFIAEAIVQKNSSGKTEVMPLMHDLRNSHYEHDEEFKNIFNNQFSIIKAYTETVIGNIARQLDISKAFYGPSDYMTLIHSLQFWVTKADISICSPYFTDSVIHAGPFTIAGLYEIYWFEDRLYTIRMKGHEIKNLLERSYALWTNTIKKPGEQLLKTYTDEQTGKTLFKNLYFNFDSAAGIDYVVDVGKPEGQKITIERMSDGRPFCMDEDYTVVTIANRANGGGQMLTKGAGIPQEQLKSRVVAYTPYDVRHYLRLFVEQCGTVDLKTFNNWSFIPNRFL